MRRSVVVADGDGLGEPPHPLRSQQKRTSMPPTVVRDGKDADEEDSSIGSFDHLDSSIISMMSVTAEVVAAGPPAGTPGAAHGAEEDHGRGNGDSNTGASNSDQALPVVGMVGVSSTVDASTPAAANGNDDNNIDQPSPLPSTQRRQWWYPVGVFFLAALVATEFIRLKREIPFERVAQLETEVQSLRLEFDMLRENATRDRHTLCAELGYYKSIITSQQAELGKMRDDLVDATLTLRALQATVNEYASRRIGSNTLHVDLEPVPQLLMRDIWDEQEHNVVSALSQLLMSHEPDYKVSSNYAWGHVIMVMARWKRSAVVQKYGCQVLGHLPASAHKNSAAFGALDVILEAMKTFSGDEQLHHHALFALHQLCAKHNGNMMRLVERLGGLPIVLTSLQSFPENGLIQYWGCRLLGALSRKNQFVSAIKQAGGLAVLSNIYVMWHDGSTDIEREVVEIARGSLAALIRRHDGL